MKGGLHARKGFGSVSVEFNRGVLHVLERDWNEVCLGAHYCNKVAFKSQRNLYVGCLAEEYYVSRFYASETDEFDYLDESLADVSPCTLSEM